MSVGRRFYPYVPGATIPDRDRHVGSAYVNGTEDGWLRPHGAWGIPGGVAVGPSKRAAIRRGVSWAPRFVIFWIGRQPRDGLFCCWDDLDAAMAYAREHREARPSGVWDRRENRWADV